MAPIVPHGKGSALFVGDRLDYIASAHISVFISVVHLIEVACVINRSFVGPGHLTYPPLNLGPGTL